MDLNREVGMEYLDSVIEGDCLQVMRTMPKACVDMVLCDLPYGSTRNNWDQVIDLKKLWKLYRRVLRPGGVVVLFAQGLFTGQLINSNPSMFAYKIVWIKSIATNFLNVSKQPLRKHEDICVFYQGSSVYQPQMVKGQPYDAGVRKSNAGNSYGNFGASPIRNLTGKRYPADVVYLDDNVAPDHVHCKSSAHLGEGYLHTTQKPVQLGRWLIRTYTRPGAVVLDNACGSGSFLEAAVMEGRHFIGIEKNQITRKGQRLDIIKICRKRLEKAMGKKANLFG